MEEAADETTEDTVTLLEILSNNNCLPETQIWALCRECCLLLDFILESPEMFQSVVITPETIGLDTSGNICFLHAESDPEPLFLPKHDQQKKTAKYHIYSLGMTMLYSAKYNATNEEANAISSDLSRLVGLMTSDRPSKRPTFQAVLAECDKVLQEPSQDICQEIVASNSKIDQNKTDLPPETPECDTPLSQMLSQYTDTSRSLMSSSQSSIKEDNPPKPKPAADDNNNNESKIRRLRAKGITVAEVLENRVDFLQEAELWALCREGIISLMNRHDRLPAYISMDTLVLSDQGSLVYKAIPEDKPLEVLFMAPELQERGVLTEKTCLYGLGMTLHTAAGSETNEMSDICDELQSLLLDMTHTNHIIRPTLDEALAICEQHEEASEVPSYAICQFMFQDTAAIIIENETDEDLFLSKVSSLTSQQPSHTSIDQHTQEPKENTTTPTSQHSSTSMECQKSQSRSSSFNSSSSAFKPLKTSKPKDNQLNESAYLPRAYTSVSTHFSPIVLHTAKSNDSDNSPEASDSVVVKKLKHLQDKLMKSSKVPPNSFNTTDNADSSDIYINDHDISPDSNSKNSNTENSNSDTYEETIIDKSSKQGDKMTKDIFKKLFSDESKINQLHVLAETVAEYLRSNSNTPDVKNKITKIHSNTSDSKDKVTKDHSRTPTNVVQKISANDQIQPEPSSYSSVIKLKSHTSLNNQLPPQPSYDNQHQTQPLKQTVQQILSSTNSTQSKVLPNIQAPVLSNKHQPQVLPSNNFKPQFLSGNIQAQLSSTDQVYLPVNLPDGTVANYPVQLQLKQDPTSGMVQLVPIGMPPLHTDSDNKTFTISNDTVYDNNCTSSFNSITKTPETISNPTTDFLVDEIRQSPAFDDFQMFQEPVYAKVFSDRTSSHTATHCDTDNDSNHYVRCKHGLKVISNEYPEQSEDMMTENDNYDTSHMTDRYVSTSADNQGYEIPVCPNHTKSYDNCYEGNSFEQNTTYDESHPYEIANYDISHDYEIPEIPDSYDLSLSTCHQYEHEHNQHTSNAICNDNNDTLPHISLSINSQSSSPSPSKDSGVSVNNSAYPSLMDRLLGNDAIKQQQVLQQIVKVLKQNFRENGFFESGSEYYNIGEYVLSLCGLTWETFTSAVSEKYSNLYWSKPCLGHLYQLAQKSKDKSLTDIKETSTEHRKVCRAPRRPLQRIDSPTTSDVAHSEISPHTCSKPSWPPRCKSTTGFTNITLSNARTLGDSQDYTDLRKNCAQENAENFHSSNKILKNDENSQYKCTVNNDEIHTHKNSVNDVTEDVIQSSCVYQTTSEVPLNSTDDNYKDCKTPLTLMCNDITLDSITVKDSVYVDHFDNAELFALENSILDESSVTDTDFANATLTDFTDLNNSVENGVTVSVKSTENPDSPEGMDDVQNTQSKSPVTNTAGKDFCNKYDIVGTETVIGMASTSTPRCSVSKLPESVIDASNMSPIQYPKSNTKLVDTKSDDDCKVSDRTDDLTMTNGDVTDGNFFLNNPVIPPRKNNKQSKVPDSDKMNESNSSIDSVPVVKPPRPPCPKRSTENNSADQNTSNSSDVLNTSLSSLKYIVSPESEPNGKLKSMPENMTNNTNITKTNPDTTNKLFPSVEPKQTIKSKNINNLKISLKNTSNKTHETQNDNKSQNSDIQYSDSDMAMCETQNSKSSRNNSHDTQKCDRDSLTSQTQTAISSRRNSTTSTNSDQIVDSPLSQIQSKRGNVVYHSAELKYCQSADLKQFVQDLDPQNHISLEKKKAQIDQQILVVRKMKCKTQTFYRRLTTNKVAKAEQKTMITQVARDIKEMTTKLEFLELAKGHLEMLLSELYGLNPSLIYSLALQTPDTPTTIEPHIDNPLLQFHISRDPSSATDTRILHAGKPEGLMANLYAVSSLSDSYVHQFLYCYRYFLSPSELLQFIMDRYTIADKQGSSPQNIKIIRRSVDLFYFWLEGYYSVDFETNPDLTDRLQNFIHEQMSSSSEVNNRSLHHLLEACQAGRNMELSFSKILSTDSSDIKILDTDSSLAKKWESFKSIINRKSTIPRDTACKPRIASSIDRRCNSIKAGIYFPNSSKRSETFNVTDYSMHKMAEQLTLIEQDLFQSSHPVHFLNSKSQGFGVAMTLPCAPKTPSLARKSMMSETTPLSATLFVKAVMDGGIVDKMVEHSQLLTHWVSAEILSSVTPKTQLAVLTRFLHIAYLCLQMRNFATSMAIVDALENLIIRQLPSWKQLPNKCINIMSQLSSVKKRTIAATEAAANILLLRQLLYPHYDTILLKNDASCLLHCKDFRTKPTIPSVLVFLLHLQRLEIGGFRLVNGMYKWGKMREITELVDQLRMFKDQVFMYESDACLQELIQQRINLFLEKDLHSIAVQNDTNYQKLGNGVLQGALRKVKGKLGSKNDKF